MRMYDIIIKKRNGGELTIPEIEYFVQGVTDGSIPDYQISAFLMAVYYKKMTTDETVALTLAMANSGDMVDLSAIKGIKVDKHSTGGVGDKTTLVIAPIVAACGVPVAKMSGRGLGHTGGTVDKLEAIPNLRTEIPRDEFFEIVNKNGVCVIGQSGNLAPADKKLYALRDVTATVDCMPLIASSIMSKKLAAGSDCILLDVKTGNGAFMKTPEEATELAKMMVSIGVGAGRDTAALITDMDRPLGFAIGNSLEIIEAIDVLKGQGPEDLHEICIELAGHMLKLAGKGSLEECRNMAKLVIKTGRAFAKFKEMVVAQGGDVSVIEDTDKFEKSSIIQKIVSTQSGYISSMNTENCGIASVILGAGRETKESPIDFSAGIILKKKIGDFVNVGDVLAEFHTNKPDAIESATKMFLDAITFNDKAAKSVPLIHATITK